MAVLDLQMPDADGADAGGGNAQTARRRHDAGGVARAAGQRADAPEAARLAFAHTVTKPVKPAQLCEVLRPRAC